MRLGIISDTHGKLRPQVFTLFAGVQAILHAGDIGREDIITELGALAPVYAVHGNVDGFPVASTYPKWRLEHLGGKRIFITHIVDSLDPNALRDLFAQAGLDGDPDVLVYGHTHRVRIACAGSILTINPGAAGPARSSSKPSLAFLEIDDRGDLRAWPHELG